MIPTMYKCFLPEDITKENLFMYLINSSDDTKYLLTKIEGWEKCLTIGLENAELIEFLQETLDSYCKEIRRMK